MILGVWVVFLLWTGLVCATTSGPTPGEPVAVLFGLPRWVVLGVGLPWILASGVTAWFSLGFMKETELDPDAPGREEGP